MENLNYDSMTLAEKDALVSECLSSEQGLRVLASSMANPIRFEMDYYGIGRKLLVVDPLAQGIEPIYDKDIKIPVYTIGRRGQAPDTIVEGERVTVPTFDLIAYPQAKSSEIQRRRFNLIDRIQTRARLDLVAEEDRNVINALSAASASGINPVTNVVSNLTKNAILAAMGEVGKWDLRPLKLVMNYQRYLDILRFGEDDMDLINRNQVIQTGLLGRYMGLEILVSKMVPVDSVYIVTEPEYLGVMPIRQDVNVIPADKPEKLRIGFVVNENIGIAIVNPRGISKIAISGTTSYTPWNRDFDTIGEAIYGPQDA